MAKDRRLTIKIKEQIVIDLLKHAFADTCTELVNKQIALGEEVYQDYITTNKTKVNGGKGPKISFQKILETLPVSWGNKQAVMKIQFGSDVRILNRHNGFEFYSYREENNELIKPNEPAPFAKKDLWSFPPNITSYNTLMSYAADHKFSLRLEALSQERDKLVEEIKNMRAIAHATVDSVTTLQKLIKLWPEVEPFASKHVVLLTENQTLPASTLKKLNDTLKLPVE